MEPIRILQVVTLMNRGGLESMLMNYYRNIDRNKIQFDFLVHRNGEHDFDNEILSLGGRIYTLPPVNPMNTNGYRTELNNFFKQHQEYDVIHSHLDAMSTYPLKAAKKNNVTVRIAHSHNTNQEKNWKYLIKLHSRYHMKKYTTHLFSCGKEAGDWLFGNSDYHILNNAIDTKSFIFSSEISKRIKRSLGIENKFVVGHIGRFNKQKNHEFMIDIFEKIHQIDENSVLVLIGVGELEEKIKNKVEHLGLSSVVKFLGLRTDITDLLQGIDIFLFPSLYEGLPVTLIEAQASGLKCVVSDTISKEVQITNNLEFESIQNDTYLWADKVLKNKLNYARNDMFNEILRSGFDIKRNAEWLQEYYLSLTKRTSNE